MRQKLRSDWYFEGFLRLFWAYIAEKIFSTECSKKSHENPVYIWNSASLDLIYHHTKWTVGQNSVAKYKSLGKDTAKFNHD